MQCLAKDELEQDLSDIRRFAARLDVTSEERAAAVRAKRFAIRLLQEQYVGTQREAMPTRHTTLRPNLTSVAFAEESRATNDRRGCSQVSVDSTASQYCPRRFGSNRPGTSHISSGAAFHSSTRNRGAAHLRFKLLRDLVKVCPGWKFED
jgi:hypothetical protein